MRSELSSILTRLFRTRPSEPEPVISPSPTVTIETLGLDGSDLAPTVDWSNPPIHIPPERVEPFKRYLVELGVTPETIDLILNNIRYISPELTTRAIEQLAIHFSHRLGIKPHIFVHHGRENRVQRKSGEWMAEELSKYADLDTNSSGIVSVDKAIKLFRSRAIPKDTTVIVPDDLSIFGEQISQHVVGELVKECGSDFTGRIEVGLLAGTNMLADFMQASVSRKILSSKRLHVTRIFDVPQLEDLGISESDLPRWDNSSYILTFFHHKVSDRFLPLLTRYESRPDATGTYRWLVDNILVGPPYEPDRFTTGNWSSSATVVKERTV